MIMNKYVCGICGYVYDEDLGVPEEGVAAGTKWAEVPETWACPMCGASKDLFEIEAQEVEEVVGVDDQSATDEMSDGDLSSGALGVLFSNLAKGCEKQYKYDEQALFQSLSTYYKHKQVPAEEGSVKALLEAIDASLATSYKEVNKVAEAHGDRGSLRALVWSEKVTRMQKSLIGRYEKNGSAILADTTAYVCEICGFIYVGDQVPDVCPVCKVPSMKITEVRRG